MLQKFLLILFGIVIGAACITPVILYAKHKNEGAHFASLNDLRRSMSEHDERDVKEDGSVSLRSIIQPHASDDIIYTLRPNLNVKFQGVPVRTNSFGMRGAEISEEKQATKHRIAMLGDSFAFGWGVNEEESFAHKLGEKLNAEVLNFGVPGYSTFQEVASFLDMGIKFKPDAVIIFYIDNDAQPPFFIDVGDDGLQSALSFFRSEDQSKKQVKNELRKKLDPNRAIKKLATTLADKNIQLMLAINPGKNWDRDRRSLWVIKEVPNLQFINLREGMLTRIEDQKINPKDLSLPTDPHPSALKHEILADLMAKYFIENNTLK